MAENSKLIEREFIFTLAAMSAGVFLVLKGKEEMGAMLISVATGAYSMSRGMVKKAPVFLLALVLSGCVTRSEVTAQVRARRAFFNVVAPVFSAHAMSLPEPARTQNLRVLEDEALSIKISERAQ